MAEEPKKTPLSGRQFPVLREETSDFDMDTSPYSVVRFTAIDTENQRPVSHVGYLRSRWETKTPSQMQRSLENSRPGTDVPMFRHIPAKIEAAATHSDYRRGGHALSLINDVTEELWRSGEVPVGHIPPITEALSPDSASMYKNVVGKRLHGRTETEEQQSYWTTSRAEMDKFSDEKLPAEGDARPAIFAELSSSGKTIRGSRYSASVVPEPKSSIEEKLAQINEPKPKTPRRKPGPDLQMRLPGI